MALPASPIQAGEERLWTVTDVAKYLRLSPEPIRVMARKGELPAFKLGKRLWRFEAGRIQAWLNENQNK
jgi:excisionase family DNA binding protein